jgi:hypothetical protein
MTRTTWLWLTSALLVVFAANAAGAAQPTITWASDPVRPDETVVIQGGGFSPGAVAEIARLDDAPVGVPGKTIPTLKFWLKVTPLQVSDHSLKFVYPKTWGAGVIVCRVVSEGQTSLPVTINAPDVWWQQGDQGDKASPGGWVRIFGKCLSLGGTQVALEAGGKWLTLKPKKADMWAVAVPLPASLPAGDYPVYVHNGCGGGFGWRAAGTLTVALPTLWKSEVFNVRDFGTDADKAVQAALAKVKENGGGVIYFPRGRYSLSTPLDLPPGTVLKGEGMGLVSLVWPEVTIDKVPPAFIKGSHFGIQDLTIYATNHHAVVQFNDDADGVFLHRVRIRANCYFMIESYAKPFRGRQGPVSHLDTGAIIQARGRNFEVTDCDFYCSAQVFWASRVRCGIIARNRFNYGSRCHGLENVDRVIFEDNDIRGCNLVAMGNDISTFWTNYCRNLYYAHNYIAHIYGADREMMTLDAGGGAYFGKIASAEGTHLTLAADPTYKNYEPVCHTDWTGGAVQILAGTGAGQWRAVAKNNAREWDVDRPWDILPDSTSVISIAPHRGRHLFIGNTYEDGGAFQLYGAALDTIVAENKGARMSGFFAWGLNPHGWGWQPCFNCQFLDNEIIEGNAFGREGAFIGAFTSDTNDTFPGPLARTLIFRRNVLNNNSRMRLHATLDNVLIEHSRISHAEEGIVLNGPIADVLLRDNTFEDVAKPYAGDAQERVRILPAVK